MLRTAAAVTGERLAAVLRPVQADAEDVHVSVVRRVDPDLAEVHRARVDRVDASPCLPAVLGPIDAAVLEALRALLALHVGHLAAERSVER